MSAEPALIAAVEGGGTSFRVAVCQLSSSNARPIVFHRTSIDSSHDNPAQTLEECAAFLAQHKPAGVGYAALGLATFGPVGVNPDKADYGCILKTTPKASWRGVDLLKPLADACRGSRPLAIRVDTDVNAPAVAEFMDETSKKEDPISSLAYVTVGTGVGVGLVIHGKPVHGRMHPEGGHVAVQPIAGDTFGGYSWGKEHSPFTGINTVEGLASSVALVERLQERQPAGSPPLSREVLAELPDHDEIWVHAANAIACLCVNLLLTVSVEHIVLGGGLLQRKGLLEQVQRRTKVLLNGYLELPEDMSTLITVSQYGNDAGLMGAMVLAQRALTDDTEERETRMKQVAFGHGLWHGLLVGAVGTAVVCKFLWNRRK